VFHCGAMVPTGPPPKEVSRVNVQGTRELLSASAAASVRRVIHFSEHRRLTAIRVAWRSDETYAATSFRNWYAQTKLQAEAEVRRFAATHDLDAVHPAALDRVRPRSGRWSGDRPRDRGGHMVLIGQRQGDPRVSASWTTWWTPRARDAPRWRPRAGVQRHRRSRHHLARACRTGSPTGLDVRRRAGAMPYRLAEGVGFSLEHGYRALHRTTRPEDATALSRQAVHVMGTDQSFSNRKARELLTWEPRVRLRDRPGGHARLAAGPRALGTP